MYKIVLAVLAAALFAGCASEKAGVWTELQGEWNVVEIDGMQVVADSLENRAYIGFSPADTSIFGCAGCNRLVGRIGLGYDATVADFSAIGTTMMMCADMSVENVFLPALREVKSYYTVSESRMEFRDSEGKVRMVLEKAL